MPRKRQPSLVIGPDWYVNEWLATLKMSQADLGRATGWGKARVSEICSGKTNYYREIVNEIARAMNIHPFELLLHPDDAMAIRRLSQDAVHIAADRRAVFNPPEPETSRLEPKRKTG